MTNERLKRNLKTLQVLAIAFERQRKAIIHTSTWDQILCICDCATNILNENISLIALSLQTFHVLQGVNV